MKKIKIPADPLTLSMAIIGEMCMLGSVFLYIYFLVKSLIEEGNNGIDFTSVGLISFTVLSIVCFFIILNKLFVFLEMDEKGLQIIIPFKKKMTVSYEALQHIQLGFYDHATPYGVTHHIRVFVVLSKKPLTEKELSRVNELSSDEEHVKIKLCKKSYQKLIEILPEKHKEQLQSLLKEAFPQATKQ